jgi:hypothetical protein
MTTREIGLGLLASSGPSGRSSSPSTRLRSVGMESRGGSSSRSLSCPKDAYDSVSDCGSERDFASDPESDFESKCRSRCSSWRSDLSFWATRARLRADSFAVFDNAVLLLKFVLRPLHVSLFYLFLSRTRLRPSWRTPYWPTARVRPSGAKCDIVAAV